MKQYFSLILFVLILMVRSQKTIFLIDGDGWDYSSYYAQFQLGKSHSVYNFTFYQYLNYSSVLSTTFPQKTFSNPEDQSIYFKGYYCTQSDGCQDTFITEDIYDIGETEEIGPTTDDTQKFTCKRVNTPIQIVQREYITNFDSINIDVAFDFNCKHNQFIRNRIVYQNTIGLSDFTNPTGLLYQLNVDKFYINYANINNKTSQFESQINFGEANSTLIKSGGLQLVIPYDQRDPQSKLSFRGKLWIPQPATDKDYVSEEFDIVFDNQYTHDYIIVPKKLYYAIIDYYKSQGFELAECKYTQCGDDILLIRNSLIKPFNLKLKLIYQNTPIDLSLFMKPYNLTFNELLFSYSLNEGIFFGQSIYQQYYIGYDYTKKTISMYEKAQPSPTSASSVLIWASDQAAILFISISFFLF